MRRAHVCTGDDTEASQDKHRHHHKFEQPERKNANEVENAP
jgi:hypothetical protein